MGNSITNKELAHPKLSPAEEGHLQSTEPNAPDWDAALPALPLPQKGKAPLPDGYVAKLGTPKRKNRQTLVTRKAAEVFEKLMSDQGTEESTPLNTAISPVSPSQADPFPHLNELIKIERRASFASPFF